MKPKNLKEFKTLKKRYESITLKEMKEQSQYHDYMKGVAEILTGFGNSDTCSLCTKDGKEIDCDDCVYLIETKDFCDGEINYETYEGILNADTPIKLRNAFRARAKHMKTLI